jgi:hypothetical protein
LLAVALARGVVERLPVSRADAFAFGPALIVRPALIARPSQPRVELVLDRALDDQPRSEPGQPRQRLALVLTDHDSQQPVDLRFDLRRRR